MIFEYSLLTLLSLIIAAWLDVRVFKTKIVFQKKYYIFLIFQLLLHTIVDNWLNGRYWLEGFIVGPYDSSQFSGIYIWQTPLENYFFGIALVLMNISFFEYLNTRKSLDKR